MMESLLASAFMFWFKLTACNGSTVWADSDDCSESAACDDFAA